jgi:hypothetical protein
MRYASSSGKDVGELLGREGSVTLVLSISSMMAMDGVVVDWEYRIVSVAARETREY